MKSGFLITVFVCASLVNLHAQTNNNPAELFQQQNYDNVIDACTHLIASEPRNFEAWYYKGLAEQALYRFSDAVKSLQQAVELTEQKEPILFTLGTILESDGNDEEAIAVYEKLLAIDSLHIPAKARLAKVFKDQKEYLYATGYYSQLVKYDSTNSFFYSELAYCCQKMGLTIPATEYYKKAISLNPTNLKTGRQFISMLIDDKYYDVALAVIDTFLIPFPNNLHLLKQQAYIKAIGGNYLEAVKLFSHIVHLGDTSLFTSKYYGQSLYNNGQYHEAAYWLYKYLEAVPGDSKNQFILGLAYQNDYQYEKSLEHLTIAREQLYPKELLSRISTEMATTYTMYGAYCSYRDSLKANTESYYKLAVDNLLEALELYPEDYTIYNKLGHFYEENMKDKKVALYYYELYYKKLDSQKISPLQLEWIQNKIQMLKEEIHFAGYE
jgi:tetratricopeptide (TPR) repeat protein